MRLSRRALLSRSPTVGAMLAGILPALSSRRSIPVLPRDSKLRAHDEAPIVLADYAPVRFPLSEDEHPIAAVPDEVTDRRDELPVEPRPATPPIVINLILPDEVDSMLSADIVARIAFFDQVELHHHQDVREYSSRDGSRLTVPTAGYTTLRLTAILAEEEFDGRS